MAAAPADETGYDSSHDASNGHRGKQGWKEANHEPALQETFPPAMPDTVYH